MLPLPIECNTAVLRPWLYWWWHKHVNPVNNKKIMVTFVKTWTRPFCSSCLVRKTRSHCLPNKGFEIFPRHSVWEVIVINAYLSHQSWKAPGDLGWGFLAQCFVRCCQLCGYLFNICAGQITCGCELVLGYRPDSNSCLPLQCHLYTEVICKELQ